jgi:hypothetical protein
MTKESEKAMIHVLDNCIDLNVPVGEIYPFEWVICKCSETVVNHAFEIADTDLSDEFKKDIVRYFRNNSNLSDSVIILDKLWSNGFFSKDVITKESVNELFENCSTKVCDEFIKKVLESGYDNLAGLLDIIVLASINHLQNDNREQEDVYCQYIKQMVEKGADVNSKVSDDSIICTDMLSKLKDKKEIRLQLTKLFLENGLDVNQKVNDIHLIFRICECVDKDILQLFVEKGVDLNVQKKPDNYTLLDYICFTGCDLDSIKYIVDLGIPNFRMNDSLLSNIIINNNLIDDDKVEAIKYIQQKIFDCKFNNFGEQDNNIVKSIFALEDGADIHLIKQFCGQNGEIPDVVDYQDLYRKLNGKSDNHPVLKTYLKAKTFSLEYITKIVNNNQFDKDTKNKLITNHIFGRLLDIQKIDQTNV